MASFRNSQPRRVPIRWLLVLAVFLITRPGHAAPTVLPIASAPAEAETHEGAEKERRKRIARYNAMAQRVAGMADSQVVIERAARHQLDVLNVLWEDTGRWEGSSVGPNISDVTIEVELKSAGGKHTRTALMPVLRHPNFTDKTGDVPIDSIWLPVGNHAAHGDSSITKVTLRELLESPSMFMSKPDDGLIRSGSLLAKRDSHVLVSAQSTFLPIPEDGEATFWPVIFNYQSTRENPAVLTLLVTRQGTSMTVIDNARDTLAGQSWGQRLFFNKNGERAPLTAERLSRVQHNGVTANGEAASSLGDDANVLMIIQVPLKVRQRGRMAMAPMAMMDYGLGAIGYGAGGGGLAESKAKRSEVEVAVLGHGPVLGPFTELDDLKIERDARFPVRVTVQFYQATSSGMPTSADIKLLAKQIKQVYSNAEYVGSLVVPSDADRARPTAWYGMSKPTHQPRCDDFPGLVEQGICALDQTAGL
jgi:hypothetical protein